MADQNPSAPTNMPELTSGQSGRTEQMLDALRSGKTTLSVGDKEPTTFSDSQPESNNSEPESQEEEKQAFNPSTVLDSLGEEDDAEESNSEISSEEPSKDSKPAAKKASSKDIEEIMVSGPEGRRKVKVDFSDREAVKKQVQLAYGARKWQKERDDYKTQLESVSKEHSSLKSDWDKVEKAYKQSGVKGLIDLIEGREGAWKETLKQINDEQARFEAMSPVERKAHDLEQRAKIEAAEHKKLRDEYEAKLNEIKTEKEKADLRSIESRITPSFDRYRFKGTLGDEIAETEFDEMLWNRALTQLDKVPEDVELTPAMVDKEFRRIATAMRKHLNTQVDSKVKAAVNKSKQDTAKKAQTVVKRSMKSSSEVEEFKQNMKSGNLVDGLASFFKAGGKFR